MDNVELFPQKPLHDAHRRHGPRAQNSKAIKTSRARLNVASVNQALIENRGLLREAALSLGVSRHALREYVADHTACSACAKETREAMGDVAERKLFELIEAGEPKAIMYYLSTVHKNRGYGLGKGQSIETNNNVHVGTIQIVAVPSGQFLAAEDKPMGAIEYAEQQSMPSIDHTPDVLK
jgi:hypothetical protein